MTASVQAAAVPPAEARTEQVAVRLVAGVDSVQPGGQLVLGVQQRIAPHWHTYWSNPGDSGLPTRIDWQLPDGAQAGPIQWPVPQRFQLGPVTNYGYADEVTLASKLRVPASLREGETFNISAKVSWLVCHDVCIPQDAQLGLSLPVRSAAGKASPDAAVLARAQARLPAPAGVAFQWRRQEGRLLLSASGRPELPPHDEAYFFAGGWGQVEHGGRQVLRSDAGAWALQVPAGESPPPDGQAAQGVLVLSKAGAQVVAYAVGEGAAAAGATNAGAASAPSTLEGFAWGGFAVAAGLALLGGLVLNLMPCVFPVLSIKALSLMQASRDSARALRLHGLAYAAGVLASFAVLALLLVALKAGGEQVGWGFQFQSPVFVLLLGLLIFAVGLSLSGVLSLGGSWVGMGSGLAAREGASGSFFTGVLAAVVATPCTAPFMGAAIGYAATQPAPVTLAIFLSLGAGLALPYVLLCEWPALQRRLPRPGAWMERLKQGLAFPMYGTAAWLAWVLAQQAGAQALGIALAAAVALGFAAWLHGTTRQLRPRASRVSAAVSAVVAAWALGASVFAVRTLADAPLAVASAAAEHEWEPYSPERLASLRAQGKPVFVNLTAAWCITCLVNERVALNSEPVQAAFSSAGVVRLKGDWTRRDERITRLLAEHGRSGVPLYLFYRGAGGAPVVLPQLLTADTVVAVLASPRDPQ